MRLYSNVKVNKQLQKMLNRGPKKKWYASPMGIHPGGSSSRRKGYSDTQVKRADHVSKVLYTYITQIINSGEVSPFLAEKAVDIVRVRVLPDFSAANVYWLASGSVEDQAVEDALKHSEGKLRQILTSYHLLGKIPFLKFVKDDKTASQQRVQELLKSADMGTEWEAESPLASAAPSSGDLSHDSNELHGEESEGEDSVSDSETSTFRSAAGYGDGKSTSGWDSRTDWGSSSSVDDLETFGTSSLIQNAARASQRSASSGSSQNVESSRKANTMIGSFDDFSDGRRSDPTLSEPVEHSSDESPSGVDFHARHDVEKSGKAFEELRSDIYGVPRARILERLQALKLKHPLNAASSSASEPAASAVPSRPWKKQQPPIGRQDYTLRDFWREGHVRSRDHSHRDVETEDDDFEEEPKRQ